MITVVAVCALVIGLLGLVAGLLALRTLGRVRRSVAILNRGGRDGESLLEATARHAGSSDALRADLGGIFADLNTQRAELARAAQADRGELAAMVTRLRQDNDRALRRVALVRFDAFDDLAGRLSFSLALLDGNGDGVTVTSIAGRSDTRVYAKPVSGGHSELELSPEEQRAISAALAG